MPSSDEDEDRVQPASKLQARSPAANKLNPSGSSSFNAAAVSAVGHNPVSSATDRSIVNYFVPHFGSSSSKRRWGLAFTALQSAANQGRPLSENFMENETDYAFSETFKGAEHGNRTTITEFESLHSSLEARSLEIVRERYPRLHYMARVSQAVKIEELSGLIVSVPKYPVRDGSRKKIRIGDELFCIEVETPSLVISHDIMASTTRKAGNGLTTNG